MKSQSLTLAVACGVVVIAAVMSSAATGQQTQTPPAGQAPPAAPQTQKPDPNLGFTDTPMLPGLPWHVHDPARPHPKVVTPGTTSGAASSDAVVLFDGRDLAKWGHGTQGDPSKTTEAKWVVRDGYFEIVPKAGDLFTRESFGDIQLHVEWAAPAQVSGRSQGRGNSGILIMGLYEVQVLDVYDNVTYADGGAGALYGQWPPLVNAARKPGEWQTYDIIFEAPKFSGDKLEKPAYLTVFWNGVMVHNRKEAMGPMVYRQVAKYAPHAAELPLRLQDHGNPVRFRNIWLRRLSGYDQPSK